MENCASGNIVNIAPNKWLVFSLVSVGIFMSTLDGSIVNIAVPTIMGDFATDMARVRWVVISYLLAVSSLLLPFGRLSDIKGRRLVYFFGTLIFTAGSFACGTAMTINWLTASRVFQAVGAAMILSCSPALVVDVFPASERGRGMGLIGMVVASGLTVGPALGGLILEHFSWRMVFFVNVPVGILAIVATFFILKRETGHLADEPFDFLGAILLAGTFIGLLMLISVSGNLRHKLPAAFLFLGGASLLVLAEKRTSHPIIDPSLFKIRLFSASIAAAVTMFAALACVIFLMPFFLENPGGLTSKQAGQLLVAPFFMLFALSPLSGIASDRMGSRVLSTAGMAILSLALVSLAFLKPDSGRLSVFLRLALVGVGVAIFSSPNSAAAMTVVPMKRRGVAAATLATARNLGMVSGVALASAFFNDRFYQLAGSNFSVYAKALERPFMTAFSLTMTVGALVALAGAAISSVRGGEAARRDGGGGKIS
ncbi:MAG: DHA2 family efflux MFS transporter permease subunit [Deltaproteobacteria bacterium]|nr:DHA2 family efflux MFS transporter permease subunit [Deltaproteobacteria bacterium]